MAISIGIAVPDTKTSGDRPEERAEWVQAWGAPSGGHAGPAQGFAPESTRPKRGCRMPGKIATDCEIGLYPQELGCHLLRFCDAVGQGQRADERPQRGRVHPVQAQRTLAEVDGTIELVSRAVGGSHETIIVATPGVER